jgi:hypothetical protein
LNRYALEQFSLNLQGVFTNCQAGSIGDTEYVCVHGHGRLSECRVQNNVGGFPTNTGQGFQRLTA